LKEITIQSECLGYTVTEKSVDTFCDFPAVIIKLQKTGDSSVKHTTVISFIRGSYLIQIFCNYMSLEELESNNKYQKILNTFRPFGIEEDVWW